MHLKDYAINLILLNAISIFTLNISSMKNLQISLPLDSIKVLDDELELVYGGFVSSPYELIH